MFAYPNFAIPSKRLRTFLLWDPFRKPSAQQLANCGFFSNNIKDTTICYICGKSESGWTSRDDPISRHLANFPVCKKLRCTVFLKLPQEHAIVTAKHPNYAEQNVRESTFCQWPKQMKPTGIHLSEAGFFYTGCGDQVVCFFCGGSAHDWDKTDNALAEHLRLYPTCLFARKAQDIRKTAVVDHVKDCGDRSDEKIVYALLKAGIQNDALAQAMASSRGRSFIDIIFEAVQNGQNNINSSEERRQLYCAACGSITPHSNKNLKHGDKNHTDGNKIKGQYLWKNGDKLVTFSCTLCSYALLC